MTAYAKDTSAVYKPQSGSYYTLQTGTDYSYTATYKLKTTRLDWFGTKNKAPTGAEMLKQGGEVTDTKTGDTRTLNGGAIITSTDRLAGSKDASTKDGVQYSKKDVFDARKTVSFDQKEKRLWLTLGMAKKYDYTLVEKEYKTNLEQYSVLADYGIGIDFMGNENGGTLAVNGGKGNVIVGGTWSNGTGTASISGGSITQGARGYIDAGELTMTATTGRAGTAGAAIKTSAYTVSGNAAKDFAVNVVNHGVTVGAITSGGTVSLTADDTISQKAGTLVTANRVELNSDAAITGESGSFQVKTAAQEGKDYGLKANAAGNISITNTGGDLYLDSVVSKNGTVTLTTDGSFVDNNYTDYDNETAQAKLLAWGNAAVLEGSGETMSKQKDRLIAKVESKYNEFQSLKAYVNSEGVYTLDEATRKTIASQGLDVDAYIAEKQARYDALKDSVGKWTADEVKSYVESVRSDKSDIFNNASVTKEMIDGDDFLTRDEKAEVLVGSAKSAKDLLVTFTSGGIKEGITDTNTSHKGTPHVSGTRVTLTTTGGNIGQKKEDMEIDLSDPSKLTRDQLLALASAEKSDFQALENNIVKVSSVRPIDAESTGVLNAAAKGSIYLVTEGALASGSSLTAEEGVRIKGAGPIKGLTVSAGKEIVLESAGDAITDTTITGSGVLTARAKNGVDIKKSDGDLVVNTIYAAEGDVTIDLASENGNNNSLLAEERDEKESDTYVNIEGQNITVKNVKDMKGQNSPTTTTLGLQATGKTDSTTGDVTGGAITANAGGNANISLFGNSSSGKTAIEAENLTLTNTNKSFIGSGHYKARAELKVNNQGTITGGTFEGAKTTLTNSGVVNKTTETSAPAFKATETLTVDNHQDLVNGTYETDGGLTINNHTDGTIEGGTFSGGTLALTNESTVKDGSYTSVSSLTVENKENASIEGGDYKSTKGSVEISGGTIKDGTYTAKTDLTYTDGKSIDGAKFFAETGAVNVTSSGKIHLAEAKAKGNLTVTAAGNENITIDNGESETGDAVITAAKGVTITESLKSAKDTTVKANGGDLTAKLIDAGDKAELYASGKVNVTTLKAGTFATVTSGGNMTITDGTAEKNLTLTSTDGNIEVGSLTSAKGTTKLIAEKGTVKAETLTAGSNVEAKSGGDMTIANGTAANSIIMESTAGNMTSTTLTATKGNAKLIAGGTMEVNALTAGTHVVAASGGDMNITNGTAAKNLTLTSTAGNIEGTALKATTGKATLTAAKGVTISESLKSKTDSTVKAKGGDLTAKLIDAGKKADLYASGAMNVTTLKAGTDAVAKSGGDMTITTGTAANNLTMESTAGNITATTLTATNGYAKLTAHGTMDVDTVTAGDQVTATSGGDMTITDATAAQTLNMTSTAGNITGTNLTATNGNAVLNAKGTMDVGTVTAGTNVSATSGGDMTITTAAAENKLTLKSTGGNLKGTTLSAKGNAEITAHGTMDVTTLTAGNHATATSGGDMTITNATAAKNLTLTSTDGSVTGTTLKATAGTARVTAAQGVTISESLQSGASSIVKANGGDLTAKLIDAGDKADLYAKGQMNITTLKAGTVAAAEAGGNMTITTGTAGGALSLTSTGGSIEAATLEATKGDAEITAAKDVTITESLKSGKESTAKANGGDLTAKLIDAGTRAVLSAGGKMNVTTLKAGTNVEAQAGGNISITTGKAEDDLMLYSKGGSVEGTTLEATKGTATLVAAKGVTITESLKSGKDTVVNAGKGNLTAELIDAGAKADLYAGGRMQIATLKVGTDAKAGADGDVSITTGTAGDNLTLFSNEGSLKAETLTATKGTATLTADGTMNVTTLTAGQDIAATSGGDMTITTGTAANNLAMESIGGNITGTTLTATNGNADITAGQSISISKLAAGQHTTVKAQGGTLTADSITANANADLYSQGLMDIENLTAQNGTLISDDSMDVTNAKIGDTLSMTAKKDITVSQSDSVNKTIMNAGGSIQTKGENANISSDVIEMTAGENILVTDRSPVEKLTGVDTSEAAAVTTGSGKAGSLLYGEAAGYSYDVSKKGTATLTARKGTAALTAKKVEADTAVIGTEGTASPAALNITADNVGIDDLQSAADALHVMIRGNTTDNTHYAGIHNSTSGSAIVKDSRIDHLNFTGANDIGVENTTFAGNSILQTEKVLFRLWKNPRNNTAESIGKLFIHDYDIASSEYFSRICNGLTINGERFPYTADSVMNRSLFGDNYLGRDGREKEERNTFYAKELSFGEVTESEAYRVVK